MTKTSVVALAISMVVGTLGQLHGPLGAAARPGEEPLCQFTARVNWIEMVGSRQGKAVPIGNVDLYWLVGIDILSIERPQKPFKKGEQVLLIHSPAQFFPTTPSIEQAIGKEYAIELFGNVRDGVTQYVSGTAWPARTKGRVIPVARTSD